MPATLRLRIVCGGAEQVVAYAGKALALSLPRCGE
jgi:hypothetical protein